MATRFAPLKLGVPDLSGVRMHGAFGRGDRQRLMDLGKRCLEKGKPRLLLDFSDLDSLGGSGAAVLADLQKQLRARGGEVVFVAAGAVVRRFLESKFEDLPLRCFETADEALAALGEAADVPDGPSPDPIEPHPAPANLDRLLDDYETDLSDHDESTRRTADLVTAAYVSLEDVLSAASERGNPTVLGEALGVLLDAHDLAAEAVTCVQSGEVLLSPDGEVRVPVDGGIVESLMRTRRPLTMLDLEDGELWDEEERLLETLQPDLAMPFLRGDTLLGITFLKHAGDDHEYALAEVFALEMLQRLLAQAGGEAAAPVATDEPRMVALPAARDSEVLLGVKLELARGLQDAQDLPHFWQVFIARMRLAAEVTSLLFIDTQDQGTAPFAAGEARRQEAPVDLENERLRTFFRTLERPVEVANMPASFAMLRDELLDRGLGWLVSLRADDECQGVVALGLDWNSQNIEPSDEIHGVMEITAEALQRLRDGQRRASMNLGLLEMLMVGEEAPEPDPVSENAVWAVRLLARELGLPPNQERDLVLGTLVRNVAQADDGDDDLACDQLAGDAWERFRSHPDAGEQRMAAMDAPAAVRDAVRHHHERFDGRGFPLGLSGRDIPLVARLVAVGQHHALVAHRDGSEAGLIAVQQEAGKALDPDLVDIFVKAMCREVPEGLPMEPALA